jgi:hypothetical protein
LVHGNANLLWSCIPASTPPLIPNYNSSIRSRELPLACQCTLMQCWLFHPIQIYDVGSTGQSMDKLLNLLLYLPGRGRSFCMSAAGTAHNTIWRSLFHTHMGPHILIPVNWLTLSIQKSSSAVRNCPIQTKASGLTTHQLMELSCTAETYHALSCLQLQHQQTVQCIFVLHVICCAIQSPYVWYVYKLHTYTWRGE